MPSAHPDPTSFRLPRPALALALLLAVAAGCGRKPAAAPAPTVAAIELPAGTPVRVLFLGNSLTAGNDLPGIVQSMAAAGGVRLEYRAFVRGGTNLEDHWNEGAAKAALDAEKWDFVVFQQGPSTRPESRADLVAWATKWADAARARGTTPALYMVWPYRTQKDGFALVSASYRAAATAAGARIFPAGEAWAAALAADPDVNLFESDDLHATEAGSYLAGLVILHGLTGTRPAAVPADLTLMSGLRIGFAPDTADRLRRAAEATIDKAP